MEYEMKLQPKYFDYILYGSKRIEIRLFDEKRKLIKIGDKIKFLKEPNLEEFFYAKVINLYRFNTFADLMDNFPISLLADKAENKEELLSDLEQYYPKEKQLQYGVLAIEINLI